MECEDLEVLMHEVVGLSIMVVSLALSPIHLTWKDIVLCWVGVLLREYMGVICCWSLVCLIRGLCTKVLRGWVCSGLYEFHV